MKNYYLLPILIVSIISSAVWKSEGATLLNSTYEIRARLASGSSGSLELVIDGSIVNSWYVSNSTYQKFTYTGAGGNNVKVQFQDWGGDLLVDYIKVDGTTYQSEDQATNTGVWTGQCGGSYSERLDCSGYIDFGNIGGGNNGGGNSNIESGSGNSISYIVRAKLSSGSSDNLELKINDVTVKTWTVNGSYQNLSFSSNSSGNIKLYFPDNGTDIQIDYLKVDNTTYQAEAQATNTGVWQGQCGGSYSELMHCAGYIDFGNIGGGNNGGSNQTDPDIFAQNELLKYGVNMSTMEGYPYEGDWSNGIKLCENDFKRAADVGITSFRIPIRWNNKLGPAPNYTIEAAWFNRVDEVIGWGLQYGQSVIINVHHFDELTDNPNATHRAQFNAIWKQISERYQNQPMNLFFELLNEPRGAFDNDINALNSLHADALAIIRQTNPHRSVLISGRYAGSLGGIWDPAFETFPNDDDIILELHYYNPLEFTHQGAWWCCGFPTGNPWPNANTGEFNVDYELGMAANFVANNSGKPIYLGEFGALGRDINCNIASPPASRAAYVDFVIKTCVEYGMSWSHWEWKGHYGIYNEFTNNLLDYMAESIAQDQYNPNGVNASTLTLCNGNNAPSNYCSGAGNDITDLEPALKTNEVTGTNLTSMPNPFTSSTMIQFNLATSTEVSLTIVDLQGRVVHSIYNGVQLGKGLNQVEFEAIGLSEGMYFIHLQTNEEMQVYKLLLEQ